jgi:hypothetical protein
MPTVAIVDYKRVASLFRKTISVDIPDDLVGRKGNTRAGRARCRRAQRRLAEMVHAELKKAGRRAFRSDVAVHLDLRGVSLDRPDEACRTVKAILDSLEGPVYPDDRAVALLDVNTVPGPLEATIAVCSARQYADAFDVLSGVSASADRDNDSWEDIVPQDDPWAWSRDSMQHELGLEVAEENLAHLEADGGYYPADLRSRMIEFDRRLIYGYRRDALLSMPYQPTDRPGPPSIAGRLWNDAPHFPGPARIFLPAPNGKGTGSWTAVAREAFTAHFNHWHPLTPLLRDEPVVLDIAIGRVAEDSFDVDNLAQRVLRAFRESAPELPSPSAYRVYRRHGDDEAVAVGLHSVRRAAHLRHLLAGSPLALSGIRPHPDGPVYRRRPIDDQIYERVQALGVAAGP